MEILVSASAQTTQEATYLEMFLRSLNHLNLQVNRREDCKILLRRI